MLAAEKKTGTTGIVLGFVIIIVAQVIANVAGSAMIGSLLSLAGSAVFIWGCVNIAKAKGQPWYFGLLGFLSCIGLAVLWFVIEDKHKNG
jgi:thiol:disulfide interchange protein